MYAGVVHGPFDIRYEEVETPKPQAGEVLVKVKYTGICGSDLPRVNGHACRSYPMILGHEFSGTIVELGEGVTNRQVGQRIAGVPLMPCMECEDCKNGDYSLCKHYCFIGSRRNGSFAEYVALPAINTVPIGETDFAKGAFIEPITVAIHGLRCVDYQPGKRVAIVGAGTIGALTLQWCRLYGAKQIVMFNRSKEKLQRCTAMGADAGINTSEPDYIRQALAVTEGHGFDYVFETAGSSETVKMSFALAANHAKVCMIGTPKDDVVFSVQEWEQINRKEMYVTGSWMSYSSEFPGVEWEDTARCLDNGTYRLSESLIDQIIPLSKIDEAFRLFEMPGSVKGKILIDSER